MEEGLKAEADRGNGKEGVCHGDRCGVKDTCEFVAGFILCNLKGVNQGDL